ncbi:hypothetical protein ZIOFF_043907 [Zingiber officinale]|uniref:Reverse transcriptase RNase H-like domain-containing protein n=1 Tax=Zingiber officinale TaxID=94328 RepID=A0A8J5KU73_ZINOF|nr:hypothetical protein ZIOFF_043907 [Zingiber officinale]
MVGIVKLCQELHPKLGLLSSLYAKTSPNGEKRLNKQDWELIHMIKEKVKQLPDLEIPSPDYYIVLEVDGCMDGWGGICKWKKKKYDPISLEKICAYSSGKYNPPKSTIDAEIHAVMNTMEALKIYFLDKSEIIIRTDWQVSYMILTGATPISAGVYAYKLCEAGRGHCQFNPLVHDSVSTHELPWYWPLHQQDFSSTRAKRIKLKIV